MSAGAFVLPAVSSGRKHFGAVPIFDPSRPDANPRPHSNREWHAHHVFTRNEDQLVQKSRLAEAPTDLHSKLAQSTKPEPLPTDLTIDSGVAADVRSPGQTAECEDHFRSNQTACEGSSKCYWSAGSRKCFVRYEPGSEGTYAQNYQDWWVKQVAEGNSWGKGSVFLDLGAHSGLWCSNTKLLEQQLGWRGVCVEPFPVRRCPFPLPCTCAYCEYSDNAPCLPIGCFAFWQENGPTKDSFKDRTCALVDRALTGREDGRAVRLYGKMKEIRHFHKLHD
eukprot:SAG31_NODE_867_length_11367_cov_25.365992_5_plen_278_part_00